jgi:hypothetical protein
MLVERINRYLNKGLKIMVNKQDSPCIALEAIILLNYAWNSCPVPAPIYPAVSLLLAANSNSQSTSPLESTSNSCLCQAPSSLTPASLLLASTPVIKLHLSLWRNIDAGIENSSIPDGVTHVSTTRGILSSPTNPPAPMPNAASLTNSNIHSQAPGRLSHHFLADHTSWSIVSIQNAVTRSTHWHFCLTLSN